MVNNIAANVLGGKPEIEGGAEIGGTRCSLSEILMSVWFLHILYVKVLDRKPNPIYVT